MVKMNEIKSMYTFLKDDGKRRGIIIKLLYQNDILCISSQVSRERGEREAKYSSIYILIRITWYSLYIKPLNKISLANKRINLFYYNPNYRHRGVTIVTKHIENGGDRNLDPYAYLQRPEFCSENFKIELLEHYNLLRYLTNRNKYNWQIILQRSRRTWKWCDLGIQLLFGCWAIPTKLQLCFVVGI